MLDEAGEKLMSLSSRLASAPNDAYWALSTADAKFPTITLSTGEQVTVSYGQYRALLATRREQADREAAFRALHETYRATPQHLRVALQRRLPARLVPGARARLQQHARSRAARRQHPDVGRREPDRDHAGRRRAAAALPPAAPQGARRAVVPGLRLLDSARHVRQEVSRTTRCSTGLSTPVAPLGPEYQARMREGFSGGWIDVYENEGKRSGAYSAPVYGTHPYMLLNYTDTLDDVFTLAHEMGHSMHTILSHEAQPFVYSSYTIFVAEVPSTLSEALLLEYMLKRSTDPDERIVLLQHAIDNITGTFFTQVMFADYELRAHRLAEQDQPITAEILTETYTKLLKDYYGDAIDLNPLTGITWARIPHFFNSPYYVYQYATCFASAARLAQRDHEEPEERRRARSLSDAAQVGRQRLSDGAVEESRASICANPTPFAR